MEQITTGQAAFLYYLQLGLWGKTLIEKPQQPDWNALFLESRMQTVLGLVYEGILEGGDAGKLSAEEKKCWLEAYYRGMMRNERLAYAQRCMLDNFRSRNINCVILKGTSAAEAYRNPEVRTLGDIDILVERSEVEAASAALRELGYQEQEDAVYHHYVFSQNGIEIELHCTLGGIPEGDVGSRIRALFDGAGIPDRTVSAYEYESPVLSVERQACSLMLHIIQHFKATGIGFRQICDYAVFLHKYGDEALVQRLDALYAEIGILHFANQVAALCRDYLNPNRIPPKSGETEPEVWMLLTDIFAGGNFGKKEAERARGGFVVKRSFKYNGGWISALYHEAIKISPTLQKHPVLRPFAVFYLPLRYLGLIFRGKREVGSVSKIFRSVNKREKMILEYRIFLPENKAK